MDNLDYQRIAKAIQYLRENAAEQPDLDQVASQLKLSPFHVQRLFKRFAGVSPKRFLQYLTASHAKQLLRQSTPVLETSFAVGLSSPGRLHDLLLAVDAMTPGEVRAAGAGLRIRYGIHPSPFGQCLVGLTERGICRLEFVEPGQEATCLRRLQKTWPQAVLKQDAPAAAAVLARIFNETEAQSKPLQLLLQGTNFQLQVWQALLRIPEGAVASYGFLAGQNPIGYLIPCHRVLRADGEVGGYRWGKERKLAILGKELCGKSTLPV